MITLVFNEDHTQLPAASENTIPVQLYGLPSAERADVSAIGSPALERIKRLGVEITTQSMDFLSIALAVTAADTFVRREDSEDGWTRAIRIALPLAEPDRWRNVSKRLASAFHFLSGDIWEFDFKEGGTLTPQPYRRRDRYQLIRLRGLDSVCLFSGGLDSAVGVIDLLKDGRKPLFVSHSYKGDKTKQDSVAEALDGRFARFSINAHPISANSETDISMRTRSCNFIAFAAVAAGALQEINRLERVELIVPENGFISINAPLTSRRIGSLSTRTTHPYFISSIQEIFRAVEISCEIINPYQFKTKGQMISECKDQSTLKAVVDQTVSCSHWKRSNQQCGYCVPCTIRRASLLAGNINEVNEYQYPDVTRVMTEPDKRDDLMALCIAISKRDSRNIPLWVSESGPLPADKIDEYSKVFTGGLEEVEAYFRLVGIL
ncbi:Qat anti-phage system QueC-like protein QatC [Teredinibacter purpureus]|uniref:Qat anti-phage system QueC-like protein QatC n=1 Tax=Teredinibacter purpureus TaxID=2731756 RepID=UPI0005F87B83|nr:Qat anti-phage system QueC-like protein QatC [Teredinibacter purpureus]